MKKFISLLLLIVATSVIVTGCTVQTTNDYENNAITTESSYYEQTSVTTTEPTTEESRLSDSCDEVLLSAYDAQEDNSYELVANQTEDYSGVKIEIGIIKNNRWVLKPTSDMPFIGNDGSLQNGKGISESKDYFCYLGKGTFLFSYDYKSAISTVTRTLDIIYNSTTKKSYTCDDEHISLVKYKDYSTGNQIFTNPNCDYIVLKSTRYSDYYSLTLLDFMTMDTKQLKLSTKGFPGDTDRIYPISDGVIVIVGGHHLRFYDTEGNMTFDGDFNYTNIPFDGDSFVMKDGKCAFSVKNNNGTIYDIAINKKGEVISQETVE